MSRKTFGRRAAVLTGAAAFAAPAVLRAQGEPIKIATLTPLTGAGGTYGPTMAKVAKAVRADRVAKADKAANKAKIRRHRHRHRRAASTRLAPASLSMPVDWW